MNIPFLFSSGIIVVILLLIGLFYTFKEFKEMQKHPEDYQRKYNRANVVDKEKKSD